MSEPDPSEPDLNELDQRYAMLEEPGIRRFMAESDSFYPPDAVSLTMAEKRAFYARMCAHFRKPRPSGIAVEDRSCPGPDGPVPIRIYRPSPAPDVASLLYLHGGGFVVGDLDSHDDICAELADQSGLGVIAVDYRLAPEHRFPAAFDDCWAVLEALGDGSLGIEAKHIVVAGDSAGGNLAAGLALRARDLGAPRLAGQVLIYPALGGDMSRGSFVEQANAPGLTTADIRYYSSVYVGPPEALGHGSKFANPLNETDYAGLPPAFLVAAHWDPLRDDCADYAARLTAAGVAAQVRHEPLLVHAFLRARHMSPAAAASFAAITEAARSFGHSSGVMARLDRATQ